ncbi:MAG: hypothetical protein ACK4IS_07375 [Erythrobacter sp.]
MTTQYATDVRNAMADAVETAIGTAPVLRIRTGAKPENCAADRQGTVLAEVVLASNWATDAVDGVKTGAAIPEIAAIGTGQAGHWELMQGAACKAQGTVTATGGGGSMQLSTTSLETNQLVRINSFILTAGGA